MSSSWINERRAAGGQPTGVEAAPAATVVVLRDGEHGLETLLARRSSKLAFHGGAWVFPGGRIDPEDYRDEPQNIERAARYAAAREAKEEAGVDVDPEALVHVSNWTTPEISPKRFATWFFAGPVAGGTAVADGAETEQLQWFTPNGALSAHRAGEIELAPPQYVTLLGLRDYNTMADALTALDAADAIDYLPRFHFLDDGGALCVYDDDIAYNDLGNLDAPGPQHRLHLREGNWEYIRRP
ncbi:MAG TPA: NUDIX domain-containing protein [Acidimicrobiia bacterium]|nr:NUDIX domain-containing protein [Acidimicrobiia bacterium]